MRIYFNIQNNKPMPAFEAKVSERFITSLRGYVNSGSNRLKNNYTLNKQIENVGNFGFDNYTIELRQNRMGWGTEYQLVAVKDGTDGKNPVIIAKRLTYKHIANLFLNIRKNEFVRRFYAYKAYNN